MCKGVNMRTITCWLAAGTLLLGMGGAVFADDAASEQDSWYKRIASPSYGVSLAFYELEFKDAAGNDRTDTLPMVGVDLRHFNGIDVPRSRFFYYGYEIGLTAHGYPGEYSFSHENEDYTASGIFAGSVLLMLKHGYRMQPFDTGPGIGVELGMGIMGGGGNIRITRDDDEHSSDLKDLQGEGFSPALELGVEGGWATSDHYRLVARLSLMIVPEPLLNDANFGQQTPVRITLRGGFTRNH